MRTKRYLIFTLTITFLMVSCSETSKFSKNSIKNTWMLKSVIGGLQGLQLDYNGQEVNWTFYDNNTVKIDNYTLANSTYDTYAAFSTGTYTYEVRVVNNESILYINNRKQGVFTIADEKLMLDDGLASDGFLRTFDLFSYE